MSKKILLNIGKLTEQGFWECREDDRRIQMIRALHSSEQKELFTKEGKETVFRRFEKETGLVLGKTRLFKLNYPEMLCDVDKTFEHHYLSDGKSVSYVQYGFVQLGRTDTPSGDFLVSLIPNPDERAKLILRTRDEEEAKEKLKEVIEKYKLRQLLKR